MPGVITVDASIVDPIDCLLELHISATATRAMLLAHTLGGRLDGRTRVVSV